VVSFGQDLSAPIDYTTKAKPTRLVLDDLSKLAKVKLQADRPLEEEPLIVRVRQVPLQTLMDKMADVYAADWVDHHGYWQLERSDEKTAAIKKRLLDKRTQAFQDSIDALVQLEKSNPPLDAAHAQILAEGFANEIVPNGGLTTTAESYVAQSQLPSMRLAIKVVAAMDARELAAIPINTRVVYSSSPNAMQRALPHIDPKDIQEFISEQQIFHEAAQKVHAPENSEMIRFGIDSGPVTAKPTRLLCTTQTAGNELILQFAMYDEKGNQIMTDSEELGEPWKQRLARRAERIKIRAENDGYALSPLVIEMSSASQHRSKNPKPISDELRKALLDVGHHDPLSFATSDILINGGEHDNLNVIAVADDEVEQLAEYAAAAQTGKTSLQKFSTYFPGTETTIETTDGWVVVKPIDPVETASGRFPRPALQDYLNSVVTNGYASLEDRAKLAASASRNTPSNWPDIVTPLLLNSADSSSFVSLDGLRLYGTLSDEQQSAIHSGPLVLRPSDLGDDQKAMIGDIVFNDFFGWINDTGDRNGPALNSNEPTDVLPNGLTSETTVSFETKEEDVFFTEDQYTGRTFLSVHPMDQLSYMLLSTKKPELTHFVSLFRTTGFKSGKQRTVKIKVHLNPRYYAEQDLSENHPADGAAMDVDAFIASLPEDVRKKVLAEMATEEAEFSRAAGTTTQPGTPTPPPTR